MVTAEQLFLKYAFPCAQTLLDRHEISAGLYKLLKESAYTGTRVDRQTLEKSFKAAIGRMKALYGNEYWNVDNIRDYFINQHNRLIDAGDGEYAFAPEFFKRACKVYKAEVVSKEGHGLKVKIAGIQKTVLGFLTPEAKPGDRVTVHLGFGIEVL